MSRAKPKRLRFTLRTLAIVVTLVCCYAACWGPTKRRGLRDVTSHRLSLYLTQETNTTWTIDDAAMIVSRWDVTRYSRPILPCLVQVETDFTRRYYFWFFGFVAKLPYEREISGQ